VRQHRYPTFVFLPVLALVAGMSAFPALAQSEGGKQEKPAGQEKQGKEEKREAAGAEIGKPAPVFELKDLNGKTIKLSDYKGKTVVLEWFNPECPVVTYYHTKGALRDLGARRAKDGAVWLAITWSN